MTALRAAGVCLILDAATHARWLADTRSFWDAGTEFEARYRRICSSPEFDATTDPRVLERLWEEETARTLPMVLKGVPLQSSWRCLEIGSGVGRLLKPIAAKCASAVGVDISTQMVEMSRDYLDGVSNARVQLNDGKSLGDFDDGAFDFVYSHLAFQHITLFEVVDAYLAEIRRVLKPGGFCRIQNWRDAPKPATESFKDLIRPILGKTRYRSQRCWVWSEGRQVKFGGVVFTPRQWKQRLCANGLRPVSIELGIGHDYWMWSTSVRPK